MRLVEVLVVCALVGLSSAETWRGLVTEYNNCRMACLNLKGLSCSGTCNNVGVVDSSMWLINPHIQRQYCITVKNCIRRSGDSWLTMWNNSPCSFCNCNCKARADQLIGEIVKVETTKQITEPDLYGTCTGTCPRSGLVRTNFKGCNEVRNCRTERNGWLRWFVRCDYCLCDCINYNDVMTPPAA